MQEQAQGGRTKSAPEKQAQPRAGQCRKPSAVCSGGFGLLAMFRSRFPFLPTLGCWRSFGSIPRRSTRRRRRHPVSAVSAAPAVIPAPAMAPVPSPAPSPAAAPAAPSAARIKPFCASVPRGLEVQRLVVCSLREQKAGNTSNCSNTAKVSKQWEGGWGARWDSGAGAEATGVGSAVTTVPG